MSYAWDLALKGKWISPFFRTSGDKIRNLISGVEYERTSERGRLAEYCVSVATQEGGRLSSEEFAGQLAWLLDEKWLFASEREMWSASRLRYASIETVSACNQSCYFCPVSVAPRPVTRMSGSLFASLVEQLSAFESMEGIFLNNYNEPFLDKRLPDMVAAIVRSGLKVGINTNASVPFSPDNWMRRAERITLLTVNLNTIDSHKYAAERGSDTLDVVLDNVRQFAAHDIADELRIAVLGIGDDEHDREVERISLAFRDIEVQRHLLMDRCGQVTAVQPVADRGAVLAGCEQTGSRVIEHLHVLTDGRCVLCCEDYGENYVVGDLRKQSVHDVMAGEEMAKHRRKIYGGELCEQGHICRSCHYAIAGSQLPNLAISAAELVS